jgi:hypothetical protein
MKQRVVQAFAEGVSQAKLGQDLQVIYRVVGGMPSQRVEYEVNVDSVGGRELPYLTLAYLGQSSALQLRRRIST